MDAAALALKAVELSAEKRIVRPARTTVRASGVRRFGTTCAVAGMARYQSGFNPFEAAGKDRPGCGSD